MKALFDTNILLDHTKGVPGAHIELRRYADRAISIVTWIEVLVGAEPETESALRAFLNEFSVIPIDSAVAENAVALRKHRRLRLADAIIWSSAQTTGRLFVTRDVKDFPADDPGVRIPYEI